MHGHMNVKFVAHTSRRQLIQMSVANYSNIVDLPDTAILLPCDNSKGGMYYE
jgi:hypothetical protein